MVIGVIVNLSVGIACIVLGLLLWKKQRVSLLHEYHYKNVKNEDIPAYTRQMGIGLIIIGVGIAMTGLFDILRSHFWWIPLFAGIISGIIIIFKAQKKYNGSLFG